MQPFAYRDHDALGLLDEASLAHIGRSVFQQAIELIRTDNLREKLILGLPGAEDDIAGLQAVMERLIAGASDLVFLGVGGSSLGGQALAQLEGWGTPAYILSPAVPRLHFLDNLDARTSDDFFRRLDVEGARFVVISKSGGTLETIAQCLTALDILHNHDVRDLHRRFAFVVEPGESPLRCLAAQLGAPVCNHDPLLTGRFSVLGPTGALVLLATGRQVAPMRAGAGRVLENLREDVASGNFSKREVMSAENLSSPISGAMAALALARAGYDTAVLLAYGDRLRAAGEWHRQLWMESLGKNENRSSLVCALGPVDQHSQLQAWLDGTRTNWFTLLCTATTGAGPCIDAGNHRGTADSLSLLHGRSLEDIVDAQWRATADVLVASGAPVRNLELHALDGYCLGGLFMHFILETMLAARVLGIDSFSQPAVERAKQATLKRLGQV